MVPREHAVGLERDDLPAAIRHERPAQLVQDVEHAERQGADAAIHQTFAGAAGSGAGDASAATTVARIGAVPLRVAPLLRRAAAKRVSIATASAEQSRGIQQVTQAVAQMDTVTQQNAASSEQSSSAAEELAAQAREMTAMVGRFTL